MVVRAAPMPVMLLTLSMLAALVPAAAVADEFAGRSVPSRVGQRKPMSHGTPQRQAPYQPGASPYVTGLRRRPKYFVPPTNPRTPTWKMYGTPPGVVPGDWPTYAPLGFGGYRFPAVGSQAYR
jgi:hypothetical protein